MMELQPTEISSNHVPKFLVNGIALVIMLIGAYFCYNLLMYTVDKKLSSLTKPEPTLATVQLREKQLACLARNIYFEAGNEPFEGKVAVAQVTLNRVNSGNFPDDVCRVVYQKNIFYEKVVCQFSWYCDRVASNRPIHQDVYKECMEVAIKVLLEGFRLPVLQEAMYYHADYVNPGWQREKLAKIGRHIFYR